MKTNINSNAGFTLIEIMVVIGIMSVLSIGFASYLYQQNMQTKASASRQNMSRLQNTVLSAAGKADTLLQSEALPTTPLK